MCYSALLKANLKKLALEFGAPLDLSAFGAIYEMRLRHPELKIPFGIDRYFLLSQDPAEKRLAPLVRQFHEDEKNRLQAEILATEKELRELRAGPPSAAHRKKSEVRERRLLKLAERRDRSWDRISPADERIYPGVIAPVIVADGPERRLVPMRYRVRRPDGGEVPPQYNVFNARRDSLLSAATWQPLFGRSHALFPFIKFFEWVERDGKKREIAFSPENRGVMWAASLYSQPNARADLPYLSFAMVTDDPPPEVAQAGHDRCPIFLREEAVPGWLWPAKQSRDSLLALLSKQEKTYYLNNLAA